MEKMEEKAQPLTDEEIQWFRKFKEMWENQPTVEDMIQFDSELSKIRFGSSNPALKIGP